MERLRLVHRRVSKTSRTNSSQGRSVPPSPNLVPHLIFTAVQGGVASMLQMKKLGLREDK